VPAIVAVIFALAVAMLLFVPYVARVHRGRGEFAGGIATLRFGILLYLLGLLAYVLLPLPPGDFCAGTHIHPQWTLRLDDRTQFGWNILLFIPLGTFVRPLTSRGLGATALVGFGVSLTIELTQLTGTWFVFPCPYRIFDVADLLANTLGTLIGGVLTPVVRRLPWQYSGIPAATPRRVTAVRRLLGMCCDGLLLWLLGVAAAHALATWGPVRSTWRESFALWLVPALVLLGTTTVGRGSTLGQHAVLLRSVAPDGVPGLPAILLRWTIGLGGLAIVEGVIHGLALPETASMGVAIAWCTMHAFGVTRSRAHRGISGCAAGLDVVDARTLGADAATPASS
jgi:hypothetical protein